MSDEGDELEDDRFFGWWRITETEWTKESLDALGPALLWVTECEGKLRMQHLLADVVFRPAKNGASFTWEGAWEFDWLRGTGQLRLTRSGKLRGLIQIENGDRSEFKGERTSEPDEPVPGPPAYCYKWGRRRPWRKRW